MIGPAISLSAVGENALDFSWIPAQSFAQPPRRVERYGAASTSSASIGDSDAHRRYSSLVNRLRGRRLQA